MTIHCRIFLLQDSGPNFMEQSCRTLARCSQVRTETVSEPAQGGIVLVSGLFSSTCQPLPIFPLKNFRRTSAEQQSSRENSFKNTSQGSKLAKLQFEGHSIVQRLVFRTTEPQGVRHQGREALVFPW